MDGLIIAAGQGERLNTRGDCKPLVHLQGEALIERVIKRAVKGGVSRFQVVTGYQSERLGAFLVDLQDRMGVPIGTLYNDQWERENGLSVLTAKQVLDRDFILLMSDHLFDSGVIRRLLAWKTENRTEPDTTFLCIDRNLDNPLVDLEDVTRVQAKDQRIVSIGKGLVHYDCFDTGIFLCSPFIFSALETSIHTRGDATLSGAMRVLAESGLAGTFDITGSFWIDVDDEAAYAKAEKALLQQSSVSW